MTTRRRTAVAVSGLALLVVLLIAGGCGSVFETNQQACQRRIDYFRVCVPDDGSVPPGVDRDEFLASICALAPAPAPDRRLPIDIRRQTV